MENVSNKKNFFGGGGFDQMHVQYGPPKMILCCNLFLI